MRRFVRNYFKTVILRLAEGSFLRFLALLKMTRGFEIMVSCSGLLIFFACTTTPVTKRRALNFMPASQMHQMGAEAYQDILSKEKVSNDRQLTAQVVHIGRRIAEASGKKFDWEFNLIENDKTMNAFCLPGGKVAVYTGILPVAKNEAGLAAIMGHEVAHAVLRHGAERMSQAIAVQLGVAVTSLSFKNSKHRGLIAAAMGIGLQYGVMLPYSRKHESEADKVGLRYMAKAGYDPAEAVELWQRMARSGGRPPELLSTHPDPLRRAKALKKQLPKVADQYANSDQQPSRRLRI